jgi:hypothetical protein
MAGVLNLYDIELNGAANKFAKASRGLGLRRCWNSFTQADTFPAASRVALGKLWRLFAPAAVVSGLLSRSFLLMILILFWGFMASTDSLSQIL